MKRQMLLLALGIAIILPGCSTTLRGLVDNDFREQYIANEINPLFPEITDIYSWMKNDFGEGVTQKTASDPKELQTEFNGFVVFSYTDSGVAHISSGTSGWNYEHSTQGAIDRSFAVRDEMFITLAKMYNFTVVRYKYDFSKTLINKFGLEALLGRERLVNRSWRYTYIAFNSANEPVMAFIPVVYGVYLQTTSSV